MSCRMNTDEVGQFEVGKTMALLVGISVATGQFPALSLAT